MVEPRTAASFLAALFERPELYLREIDPSRREACFLRMTRGTYARSSFLDWRALSVDGNLYCFPLETILERFRACAPAPRRLNYIFHTAFCGSTLLSRCLDRPGVCLAYKEPSMLHRLGSLERYQPEGARRQALLLDLVLALLSRTYGASEVPLIKPSDSCINLARDLLTRHDASAGLLLYGRLESFLVSMLKNARRRRYVRGMIPRARIDLERRGRLPGIDPFSLPDARAAGFVWIGLMVPYLDLLADERLRVRSLESSVFTAHPAQAIEAAARFFGLALTGEDVRDAVDGIFRRNSKFPHEPFDQAAYAASRERRAARLAGEVRDGMAWVADVTRDDPIPDLLPRPLLTPAAAGSSGSG